MSQKRKFLHFLFFLAIFFSACGGLSKDEVDKLIKDLKSSDTSTKNQAALKLAAGGEEAKRAVPGLIALLKDKNGGVQTSAAFALRKIGTPEAEEALEEAESKK